MPVEVGTTNQISISASTTPPMTVLVAPTAIFATNAGYALIAETARTASGLIQSASVALTANSALVATSASYTLSSSHAQIAISSSLATIATTAISSSFATSSSYALTSSAATSITFTPATASFAVTSSYANLVEASHIVGTPFTKSQLPATVAYEDEANIFTQNQTISGSLNISGNINAGGHYISSSVLHVEDHMQLHIPAVVPGTPDISHAILYSTLPHNITTVSVKDNFGATLTLARDNVVIAKNTSGVLIGPGTASYISSATGDAPNLGLSISSISSSMPTIGLAIESIAHNSFGRIMTLGVLSNIDTSLWAEGERLYVSPSVSGGLTNIEPVAPNITQRVGFVIRSSVANGIVLVNIAHSVPLTASYALTSSAAASITFVPVSATSASYALSASHSETSDLAALATTATSASFATTASAATSITFTPATASYALTASFVSGTQGSSVSASYALTSSAATSITFVPSQATSASYSVTSSHAEFAKSATSSSYALSASFAPGGQGAVGPGTPHKIAKFLTSTTIGDSNIQDSASVVFISSSTVISSSTIISGNLTVSGTLSVPTGFTTLRGIAYTWPSADGGLNTVLTTDSSGQLTWTSKQSGSVDSATSASYALTASYAETTKNVVSSSYALTSSAATSITFVPASATSASYALSASHAEYADSAGAATTATSASFAITASAATSITFTASRSQLPPEIAYEDEANVFRASQTITGSLLISGGNINATGYSVTASEFRGGGSQVTGVISSSYAISSSHTQVAISAGTATTATTATSSSFATTASAATSITFVPASATSASYAISASHAQIAISAGTATTATSASFATTSSAATSITFIPASATSASYALSASHAETSDLAALATTATSASFAVTASAATSLTFTASRSQLPPEIAYEDEANVFTRVQGISASLYIGNSSYSQSIFALTGNGTTSSVAFVNKTTYSAFFADYVVTSGTIAQRAGTFRSSWLGGALSYDETTTTDVSGSTTFIRLSSSMDSNNSRLDVMVVSGSWTMKTIIKSI